MSVYGRHDLLTAIKYGNDIYIYINLFAMNHYFVPDDNLFDLFIIGLEEGVITMKQLGVNSRVHCQKVWARYNVNWYRKK